MTFSTRPGPRAAAVTGLLLAGVVAGAASAQLRIVDWNVSNYSGGRVADIETATYGVNPGNGLSMAPDVILGQEFFSSSAVTTFRNILNNAPGSPGDWASAPFSNGNDTDNAFFYRTSKVVFLGMSVVAIGGPAPNHPRDINRYDIRVNGYDTASAVIACYSSHMKAGTGGSDKDRRLLEAQRIRDDAAGLPSAWTFLLGADLNIRDSSESAYGELVDAQASNLGRFFDPIATPGSWNNSSAFRFVHTQDPIGAGGMDDRYDQILLSGDLIDGNGLDYIGNASLPYSTATWNDANHSYRSWGNDGSSFNTNLTTTGNTMVGSAIAIALRDVADGAGHLPVLLDLRVPTAVASDTLINFGPVAQGSVAALPLDVENDGDDALWTAAGIDALTYTLTASPGISLPFGPFTDAAGGGANTHFVELDTAMTGFVNGVILIDSNAPDEPVRVVTVVGEIIAEPPSCPADVDGSGDVAFPDLLALLAAWGPCAACPEDIDGNGEVAFADLLELLAAWGVCP